MADVTSTQTVLLPADVEAILDEDLAEIRQMQARMRQTREEINRLKTESHRLMRDAEQQWHFIQESRAESLASLARLKAMV